MENKELQAEEINSLSAIFGEDFKLESNNIYSITIYNSSGKEIYFQVTIPERYPLYSSPKYQISAPWMEKETKYNLCRELEKIASQYIGESIIYLWIDFIKNFIEDSFHSENDQDFIGDGQDNSVLRNISLTKDIDKLPEIEHGEKIVLKKSIFQAHLARLVSVDQVEQVLEKLKENTKIASAHHNIYAYRILEKNNSYNQDFEDDGEHKAGPVLLKLLEVLNLSDILIVVTRWFGGIHLGSDRFKCIQKAALKLISDLGLSENQIKQEPHGRMSKQ